MKHEEIKETNAPQTYEEALKAFKAQWADKRKEEKAQARVEEKVKAREESKIHVANALESLRKVAPAFNRELRCVFTRLEMFLKDEKYTRKGE